jgi:hypothetical protein
MSNPTAEEQLVPLGSVVRIGLCNWIVGAVGFVGERYYWLTHGKDEVAMFPASMIEALWREKTRVRA